MPLPSDSVIRALFESYFNMRAKLRNWKIQVNEDGSYTLPEANTTEGKKVGIITQILSERKNDCAEYIKLVETILEAEQAQDKEYNRRNILVKTFIIDPPYLSDVLRAVRSYIVSTLASDPRYKHELGTHVDNLSAALKTLEVDDLILTKRYQSERDKITANDAEIARTKLQITAFNNPIRFDIGFFSDKVSKLDPISRELQEASFEDFVSNAIRNTRATPICDQITPKPPKPEVPANRKETRAQTKAKAEEADTGITTFSMLANDKSSKPHNASAAQTRTRRTSRPY